MGILDFLSPGAALGSFLKTALTGPLIGGMVDGYKAKLAQDNNVDTILADIAGKQLIVEQRQRELDVQLDQMDNGRWWTAAPRAIVCWSCALWIFKIVVWDKILGLGVTIGSINDPMITNAFNLIIAMWFGGRTLEKITKTVVNRIK